MLPHSSQCQLQSATDPLPCTPRNTAVLKSRFTLNQQSYLPQVWHKLKSSSSKIEPKTLPNINSQFKRLSTRNFKQADAAKVQTGTNDSIPLRKKPLKSLPLSTIRTCNVLSDCWQIHHPCLWGCCTSQKQHLYTKYYCGSTAYYCWTAPVPGNAAAVWGMSITNSLVQTLSRAHSSLLKWKRQNLK